MRVGVIVNPIAGRRGRRAATGARRQDFARRWLAHHAIDGDVVLTTGRGHAAALARTFADRGVDRIVAWGGDGTINEVAGPLIGSGVVLGLVRAGSGNGLARGLDIPGAPHRALAIALAPAVRRVDVGWIDGRHFLNVAGLGFDAAVAQAFDGHRARGLAGYVSTGLTVLRSYRSAVYQLDLGGTITVAERFLVAFANGPQYGSGCILDPDADPSDGWLNAVVVGSGSPLRQFWRARRLLFAPARPAEGVSRCQVREARVCGPRLPAHVDGEAFTASGDARVRLEPGAIRIAAPPGIQAFSDGG